MKWFFAILLILPIVAAGQEIQEYAVPDFSGGLVNSIANSLMKDNQATILENYDITKFGALKRRKGMTEVFTFNIVASDVFRAMAVFPYYNVEGNDLLALARAIATGAPRRTDIGYLLRKTGNTDNFGDSLYWRLYNPLRNHYYPANSSFQNYHNHLIVANSKSEMLVYDGDDLFPARPIGPGQPRVTTIDGAGRINREVQYIYAFYNSAIPDTSPASTPSWPSFPNHGSVFIEMDSSIASGVTHIFLYRADNGEDIYHQLEIIEYAGGITYYLDTLAEAAGIILDDSTMLKLSYQEIGACGTYEMMMPPGGFNVEPSLGYVSIWDSLLQTEVTEDSLYDSVGCPLFIYAVQFLDSAGRASYVSAFCGNTIDDTVNDTSLMTMLLTNIPVSTNPKVKYKRIWRNVNGRLLAWNNQTAPDPPVPYYYSYRGLGSWYRIATIDNATTVWEDNEKIHDGYPDSVFQINYLYGGALSFILPPALGLDDSILTFQPSDVALYGDRLYAIGHPLNRNHLYYSAFGRPTTFPYDKFILLESRAGDWFQRLLSIGSSLLGFRQNSIVQVSGLSFYQYRIDEISRGVGITAPRSLAYGNGQVYFAHSTGVYRFGSFETPVSYPIKNSLDSAGDYLRRAYGNIIEGEYWFSCAVGDTLNNETYIYSPSPAPHWKSYSFGLRDAVQYDTDTLAQDYNSQKWLLVTPLTGEVFRYNYTSADSLDGSNPIICLYRSKTFFDNPSREKIFYIDLVGTGSVDSLRVTVYDDFGGQSVKTITRTVSWTAEDRQRFVVNEVMKNLTVKIQDFGYGNYELQSYHIGYLPWDKGRTE